MSARPVSTLERVDAILDNPATFALAALVPDRDRTHGGRPSHYPRYMVIVYEALISVYGSARQVEAELAHPLVWNHIRRTIHQRFPDEKGMRLPAAPMRRHHYHYARAQCLATTGLLDALMQRHRELAAQQAVQLGLCDPDVPGSRTHPHLDRMLHADGKVITPLYRARADELSSASARYGAPTPGELRGLSDAPRDDGWPAVELRRARGLHAASTSSNGAFALIRPPFGQNAGMWPKCH